MIRVFQYLKVLLVISFLLTHSCLKNESIIKAEKAVIDISVFQDVVIVSNKKMKLNDFIDKFDGIKNDYFMKSVMHDSLVVRLNIGKNTSVVNIRKVKQVLLKNGVFDIELIIGDNRR